MLVLYELKVYRDAFCNIVLVLYELKVCLDINFVLPCLSLESSIRKKSHGQTKPKNLGIRSKNNLSGGQRHYELALLDEDIFQVHGGPTCHSKRQNNIRDELLQS